MTTVHESRVRPKHRTLDTPKSSWPTGTTVVSADSHFLEPLNWTDYLPAKYKDRGPRGHRDEIGFHMAEPGVSAPRMGMYGSYGR